MFSPARGLFCLPLVLGSMVWSPKNLLCMDILQILSVSLYGTAPGLTVCKLSHPVVCTVLVYCCNRCSYVWYVVDLLKYIVNVVHCGRIVCHKINNFVHYAIHFQICLNALFSYSLIALWECWSHCVELCFVVWPCNLYTVFLCS